MNKTKVVITDKQKNHKLPSGIRMLVRRACSAVLVTEEFADSAEVNVTFVDDEEIKKLNTEFRNIENSTDVLSFPLGENGIYDINPENGAKMLGDIVISVDHAFHQAELYGHTLQREIAFLTVHSMLHLLGYDHMDDGPQKALMRKREEEIAAGISGMQRT